MVRVEIPNVRTQKMRDPVDPGRVIDQSFECRTCFLDLLQAKTLVSTGEAVAVNISAPLARFHVLNFVENAIATGNLVGRKGSLENNETVQIEEVSFHRNALFDWTDMLLPPNLDNLRFLSGSMTSHFQTNSPLRRKSISQNESWPLVPL